MNSLKLIEDLSNANGISGFEDQVLQVVEQRVKDSLIIKKDSMQNLYLYSKNFDQKNQL